MALALPALVVASLAVLPALPAAAQVGPEVGLAVALVFPPMVSVGQGGLPAQLAISNSTSIGVGPVTISQISLFPACQDPTLTPCSSPDLGVFALSPTGVGSGSGPNGACAGVTFTITAGPGPGQFTFAPSTTIMLNPPGSATNTGCIISFTFDVLKAPTVDADPLAPGLQTRQFATVSGSAQTTAAPISTVAGTGTGSSITTVVQATPTINTVLNAVPPTAPPAIGTPLQDAATISGLVTPSALSSLTFNFFGPNNTTCTGAPIFTSTVPVNAGNGTYSSAPFTPTQAGTYQVVVVYGGDANNAPLTTPCNAANESVLVPQATPALTTILHSVPPTLPPTLGRPIADSATLTGLVNPQPGATITFNFYGPNNATCTGTPIFVSIVPVNAGNGVYPSGQFPPTQSGTYSVIAVYSGDVNNAAITTLCSDPDESVAVGPFTVGLSTVLNAVPPTASPAIGTPIADAATITGLVTPQPGATITFNFYGPNNPTCTGTPIFTSTVPVNAGNGTYPSASFTPTQAGTYSVIAVYSGDISNAAATTLCNDANESVLVPKAAPALTTILNSVPPTAPPTVGTPIADSATLTGLVNPQPGATITFNFYGPNNATCTGTPTFVSVVPVNAGNGIYPSSQFTPTQAGTYSVIASYSGDVNNAALGTLCSDANESIVIGPATPALTTALTSVPPTASPTVGTPIADSATLTGLVNPQPGATITFNFYGPGNATCTGTPIFVSTVPVNAGNGTYPSAQFTPTQAGTYSVIAVYSGDVNNIAIGSLCNDANESIVIGQATPTLVTAISAPATLPGGITDTATISGLVNPVTGAGAGTITFDLFGPNNPTCTGTPTFTSVVPVIAGNGTYTSDVFSPSVAGVYGYVATYSGDANNAAVGPTACGDPTETSTVSAPPPLADCAVTSITFQSTWHPQQQQQVKVVGTNPSPTQARCRVTLFARRISPVFGPQAPDYPAAYRVRVAPGGRFVVYFEVTPPVAGTYRVRACARAIDVGGHVVDADSGNDCARATRNAT